MHLYEKRNRLSVVLMMFIMLMMTSCSGLIFDEEGDCSVTYRLRFRYDMNMKFADAFSNEVTSVNLYAFDKSGKLVWQTSEAGERLRQEDYSITLDLAAGQYTLMAWCGLDDSESFFVAPCRAGITIDELHCRLNRDYHEKDGSVSLSDLNPLFHGIMDVDLPVNIDGGEYTYVMPLTKDTNVFRVVLQHLSGKDINADDFTFKIEDDNGWLNHDNSLRDDENITYHAWSTYSGSAGVDTADPSDRSITDVKVAVAELTTSRLMAEKAPGKKKPVLVIRKADDETTIARIPVTDYALLVKGNYNKKMSDQEYLDRQDEYNMTFFLDDSDQWLSTTVIINSWRVVINHTDIN